MLFKQVLITGMIVTGWFLTSPEMSTRIFVARETVKRSPETGRNMNIMSLD